MLGHEQFSKMCGPIRWLLLALMIGESILKHVKKKEFITQKKMEGLSISLEFDRSNVVMPSRPTLAPSSSIQLAPQDLHRRLS